MVASAEDKHNFMRSQQSQVAHWLRDENVQVNGILFFTDCTGMTLKHQTMWSLSDLKIMSKFWKVGIVQ